METRHFFTRSGPEASPSGLERVRLAPALLLSLLAHAALLLLLPACLSGSLPSGPAIGETSALMARLTTAPMDRTLQAGHAPGTRIPSTPQIPLQPAAPVQPQTSNHYFEGHALSRSPRPVGAVSLDLPEANLLLGPATLHLTLWIDSQGKVVSYQIDAPDLPEEYAIAVAEAFAAHQYEPGEIRGQAVNSVLRLEISSDSPEETNR